MPTYWNQSVIVPNHVGIFVNFTMRVVYDFTMQYNFPVFGDLRASTSRYWAHDRQVVVLHPAQDIKEALLGGSLVPFKISACYLITFVSQVIVGHT